MRLVLLLPLLLFLFGSARSQSTNASLADSRSGTFLLCHNRKVGPCSDAEQQQACAMHLSLHWTAKTESSVYASLLAAPLFPERGGHGPQVLAATLSGYVELIDGDGARPQGWPVSFQDRNFRSAPLLYDIDADNRVDVLVADQDGKVLIAHVGDSGQYLADEEVELPVLIPTSDKDLAEWAFQESLGEERARQKTGRTVDSIGTVSEPSAEPDPSLQTRAEQDLSEILQYLSPEEIKALPAEAVDSMRDLVKGRKSSKHAEADDTEDSTMNGRKSGKILSPHILATPAIADAEGDGDDEMIVAASYYNAQEEIFVSALLSYDLTAHRWKWKRVLDVTKGVELVASARAFAYSAPVVADLDGDGELEIAVATSARRLHIVEGHSGNPRKGFPIDLGGAVEGQIAIVSTQGKHMSIILADDSGVVYCFDHDGREEWRRRLEGPDQDPGSSSGVSVGDIDGDGELEVIVPTMGGAVWALSASDGTVRPGYPLMTPGHGKIITPVTLADLTPNSPGHEDVGLGLHLIFATFEGTLYIVDGRRREKLEQPCVNRIEIGEHIYSMIIVSDVTGDGVLDLVIGTMNGHVFCIGTETRAKQEGAVGDMKHSDQHAREMQEARKRAMKISREMRAREGSRSWASHDRLNQPTLSSAVPFQYMGHNLGAVARQGWHGIDVTERSLARHANGVVGKWVNVEFDIVDKRPVANKVQPHRSYDVTISLGMHFSRGDPGLQTGCLGPRGKGEQQINLVRKTFDHPGRHEMAVCLTRAGTYVLHVTMLSDHGIVSYSSTTVKYNHGFGDALKYGVALPLAIAVACVALGLQVLEDEGAGRDAGGASRKLQ